MFCASNPTTETPTREDILKVCVWYISTDCKYWRVSERESCKRGWCETDKLTVQTPEAFTRDHIQISKYSSISTFTGDGT
jgi:hypothetical protein